jgi:hypothetical protein
MKNYTATIGEETPTFTANSLKEAKRHANFFKRLNGLKGRTSVRLSK